MPQGAPIMFYIQFEATPRRTPALEGIGGAIVNCWIDRPSMESAISAARHMIEAHGWIVGDADEAYSVDADSYAPDNPNRQYFEQALLDREVFVFHQFPDSESH
jgi:hypothetical protein